MALRRWAWPCLQSPDEDWVYGTRRALCDLGGSFVAIWRTRSGRLIGHCRSILSPGEEVPFGVALGHLVIPFTYGRAMAEAVCPHLLTPDAPQQLISWRKARRILRGILDAFAVRVPAGRISTTPWDVGVTWWH